MTDTETLEISVNDTKQAARTFIGEVTIDAIEPAKIFSEKDSGKQWHLAVKPLNFAMRSATGAFHDWPPIRYSLKNGTLIKTGEFGKVMDSLRTVFGPELAKRGMELRRQAVEAAKAEGRDTTELAKQDPMDFVKVGQGHFLGLQGEFEMKVLEYGDTKKGGQVFRGGRESIIALRPVKPEEVSAAQAQLNGGVVSQSDIQYTTEQVEQLLTTMEGKTPTQYLRGLGRSGLTGDVVEAITNGKGLSYLQENGLVTVAADGTVNRVA